ncbi:hypothetical protein GCM10023340_30280 [Nocardioides marinquilinus]|uniref:Nudix hydrolase domain-containing protein n=1 Tax=Nocardioides marinquilinus TaxID=1210400 RepID=A0ABP9PSL7_9ACTN
MGWTDWIDVAASAVGLLIALTPVVVLVARRSDWGLRRAASSRVRLGAAAVRSTPLTDRVQRHLLDRAVEVARQSPTEPITSGLPELLRALELDAPPVSGSRAVPRPAEWPAVAEAMHDVAVEATRPGSRRLVWSWLFREETERVQAFLVALVDAVTPFVELRPVPPAVAGYTDAPDSFASFVLALTGHRVLVDAAASKARCADSVLMWHSATYLGAHDDDETFDEAHPPDKAPHCGYAPPVGSYDGPVLFTRGASLAVLPQRDGLVFVVETARSCFGLSEGAVGPPDPTTPVTWTLGGGRACKHLGSVTDADDPRAAPYEVGPLGTRIASTPQPPRTSNLTAQVAVVTRDGHVLLARRTDVVDQSPGKLTASAGGVLAPTFDVDADGLPDPVVGLNRETLEEIGLEIPREQLKPLCVYQVNADGQLVTAVLYLARVDLTADQVGDHQRVRSDTARGAYETEELVPVAIARPRDVAEALLGHVGRSDGHAMMAVLYAALALGRNRDRAADIVGAVHAAAARAESEGRGHANLLWFDETGGVRLTRNPYDLGASVLPDQLPTGVPAAWRAAWRGLHDESSARRAAATP